MVAGYFSIVAGADMRYYWKDSFTLIYFLNSDWVFLYLFIYGMKPSNSFEKGKEKAETACEAKCKEWVVMLQLQTSLFFAAVPGFKPSYLLLPNNTNNPFKQNLFSSSSSSSSSPHHTPAAAALSMACRASRDPHVSPSRYVTFPKACTVCVYVVRFCSLVLVSLVLQYW